MHLASASNGSGLCYGIHFLEDDERVHLYQRRRASLTGFGLWLRKIIEADRLVVVVTAWLVHPLLLVAVSE